MKRGRGLTAQFADLVRVALTRGLRDCRRVAKPEERVRGKTLPEVLKSTIQNLDPPKIGRVKRGRGLTAQFADLVCVARAQGLRDCRRVVKPEERVRGKTLPEVLKSTIQNLDPPKIGRVKRGRERASRFLSCRCGRWVQQTLSRCRR